MHVSEKEHAKASIEVKYFLSVMFIVGDTKSKKKNISS